MLHMYVCEWAMELVPLDFFECTGITLDLSHGPFWNGTTTDPEIITVLVNNRDDAFHYDAETSRLDLVQEVWEHEIIPFFNMKELAMLRPTCRWCDEQWQEFLKRNTFRVPEQVPTINEAMRIGFNLAKQKVFSKENPLVVVLSEGEPVKKLLFYLPST